MKFSAHEFIAVRSCLLPASRAGAADANGTGVDTAGFDEALVVLHQGAIAGAGTNDVRMQDSADNTTFANFDVATAFSQKVAATDDTAYVGRIDLRNHNHERYIRPVALDAVGAVICGVLILLIGYKYAPVSQTNAVGFNV